MDVINEHERGEGEEQCTPPGWYISETLMIMEKLQWLEVPGELLQNRPSINPGCQPCVDKSCSTRDVTPTVSVENEINVTDTLGMEGDGCMTLE